MFGNVISNAEILAMVREHAITIQPFNEDRLGTAYYRLTPGRLLRPSRDATSPNTRFTQVHDFSEDPIYPFAPNEYLVAEVREFVLLPERVVGDFIAASTLIEQGFALTAGKLDPGYGTVDGRRQKIIFGMKNQLDETNVFDYSNGIAHLRFTSLRGLRLFDAGFTDRQRRDFYDRDPSTWRRQRDDGVFYTEER